MTDADTAYCIDGCGRPAVTDRLVGFINGTVVVELTCAEHETEV